MPGYGLSTAAYLERASGPAMDCTMIRLNESSPLPSDIRRHVCPGRLAIARFQHRDCFPQVAGRSTKCPQRLRVKHYRKPVQGLELPLHVPLPDISLVISAVSYGRSRSLDGKRVNFEHASDLQGIGSHSRSCCGVCRCSSASYALETECIAKHASRSHICPDPGPLLTFTHVNRTFLVSASSSYAGCGFRPHLLFKHNQLP